YFAMSFNTTDSEGRCGQLSTDLGVYARVVSKSSIDQKKVQEELLRLRFANFTLSHGTWNLTYQYVEKP
ncbi:peptide receptor gpcr, partial [Biomphalaria glabrata]